MAIPKSASSSRRRGARILIADENPATLEFFSRLLEDKGFATSTADSGEAALQLLWRVVGWDESGWETSIVHKFADPTHLITTIEEALQQNPFPKLPPR